MSAYLVSFLVSVPHRKKAELLLSQEAPELKATLSGHGGSEMTLTVIVDADSEDDAINQAETRLRDILGDLIKSLFKVTLALSEPDGSNSHEEDA